MIICVVYLSKHFYKELLKLVGELFMIAGYIRYIKIQFHCYVLSTNNWNWKLKCIIYSSIKNMKYGFIK